MLRRIAPVVAFSAMAWAGVAQALGLGDIELQSALNEPLVAEIELLSVTPDELRSLEVFLAPAATFTRYGLDRPPYLTRIQFDIQRVDGGAIVRLTSEAPITEPFVTMLIEANWSRGRLLREYTVLLDPPIFAERAAPPPPARAPQRSTPSGGTVRRPATATPSQRPAAAPSFDGDQYVVRRNDTLWEIAERVRPATDLTTNQVMLSLFDANPAAFGGNINRLNAGATLRIPSADEMRARGRSAALTEVRRQNQDWRGGAPQNGTLRLLPPDDSSSADPARSASVSGSSSAAGVDGAAVASLERELAERDRLLSIRDRELAELRAQLAGTQGASAADIIDGVEPEAAVDDATGSVSPGVDLEATSSDEILVDNAPDETDTALAAVDGSDAGSPDAEDPVPPTPAPTTTTPQPTIAAPAPAPTLMERVTGALGSIWTWVGLGVVALLLLLPLLARMRRGGDDDSTGTWEALDDFEGVDDDSREATSRLRALANDDESIVVVEADKGRTTANLDESLAPAKPSGAPAAGSDNYAIEDTFSSETAVTFDQTDPIAEADFHMAYGLYDQAADLITGAIASDPQRRDFKEKLAEVYFVWGNQDGFVKAAEQLHEHIGGDGDDGWDKVRIMGQQIAPTHALFAGAAAAPMESVDLDFAADNPSSSGMDIDFAVDDEGGSAELGADGAAGDGLDFEFTATGAHDAGEIDLDTGDLFEASDEPPTVERLADDDSPTVERLIDDDPTVERPVDGGATQETPTIESPAVDDRVPRSDETAEIDLDDLGLDLDGIEDSAEKSAIINLADIEELDIDSSIETLGVSPDDIPPVGEADPTLQHPASGDSVTVLAPGSAASNDTAAAGDADTLLAPVDLDDSLIASASDDETLLAEESGFLDSNDAGGTTTGRVPVISDDDVDLDLDDLTAALQKTDFGQLEDSIDATVERPLESPHQNDLEQDVMAESLADDPLDLDVGLDSSNDDDAPTATRAESLDGEPDNRTMTEVGTKLDLARAYIDMGDPEGARSILREVADEGSSAQQQEARKLLDDLN
ncbi:MAG: FimV/HubP family polar landmark protein [Pseudomonadota bacterium]